MIDLCFDGRFIKPEHPDGISRFSLGLIHELAKLCNLTVLVCHQNVAEKLPGNVSVVWLNGPTSPMEILTAFKLNRLGIKVLFSPMQTTSSLGRRFKLILTLHDLIYYRHRKPPSYFNPLIKLVWRLFHLSYWPQRFLLNGADLVVTVSETTKRQMLDHRLTKRPIAVVHNAADEVEPYTGPSRHQSRDLVYMGSFIGYKNVATLVEGMRFLPDHRLLLLSKISETDRSRLSKLADAVGARVEFLDGVSEQSYHELLTSCLALVSASLDEGFGLPLIEAMERGTPIVVSNLEIFDEVGGGAQLSFPAMDPKAFADQVLTLTQQEVWEASSKASVAQAKKFSWEQSATKLLKLAEGLAS